jgi:energy-coupling factor transporter ATP-binding protein EcfA2
MVTLITGNKGSGKTKLLVERVNAMAQSSDGSVICIEQKRKLIHEVNFRVRLIASDDYRIAGYDALYGFICGICAQDNDITDIFVDATLRIGGRDYAALAAFLKKAAALDTNITFTVSEDKSRLPQEIFDFCEEVVF